MLSVIVITKNEEQLIANCLKSVKWADEIVVMDTGSTDNTVKVAREYTDKIYTTYGTDFAAWRNEAAQKAKGDWIFFIDADERVLQPLKDEILQLISKEDYAAYAISRKNIIFGKEVKYKAFWPDWVVRLIKKDKFKGYVGKVHEYPQVDGKIGYTKSSLLHLTHRNLDQVVLKSLDWSKIDAKLRLDANHPPVNGFRLIRILVTEGWNQGVIRGGFFAGTVGVIDSLLQTFSMLLTYIRLWEMQQPLTLEEKYQQLDDNLLKNGFKD